MRWNVSLRSYIIFTLASAARAFPISNLEDDHVDWKYVSGQRMAWIAEIPCSLVLLPQAWMIFSRKSTGSVSITIFGSDVAVSLIYLATILIAAAKKPTKYAAIEILVKELPYFCRKAKCTALHKVRLSQYFLDPQSVVEIPIETTPTETGPLLPLLS